LIVQGEIVDSNQTSKHIEAYYRTNQLHVAWSFWSSLIALIVGLGVLIVGIGLAFSEVGTAISLTTIAGGVLTQFVSAGFFVLYNKNLRQLNVFYERLVQHHDLLMAYGLAHQLPEAQRALLLHSIVGALLTRSAPTSELTPDLVRALSDANRDR
jgi:hypothetical protein